MIICSTNPLQYYYLTSPDLIDKKKLNERLYDHQNLQDQFDLVKEAINQIIERNNQVTIEELISILDAINFNEFHTNLIIKNTIIHLMQKNNDDKINLLLEYPKVTSLALKWTIEEILQDFNQNLNKDINLNIVHQLISHKYIDLELISEIILPIIENPEVNPCLVDSIIHLTSKLLNESKIDLEFIYEIILNIMENPKFDLNIVNPLLNHSKVNQTFISQLILGIIEFHSFSDRLNQILDHPRINEYILVNAIVNAALSDTEYAPEMLNQVLSHPKVNKKVLSTVIFHLNKNQGGNGILKNLILYKYENSESI
jgi:hypothetical protein